MKIKFIEAGETLALRSAILRDGADLQACVFEGDNHELSFHLGCFIDDELVSIASFHAQSKETFSGVGYQLRGMATKSNYQGKGIGNQLLNFAIVYLRGQKVNYLWCNARRLAYRFYSNLGFEFISEEFEIMNIGPHRTMYLKIQ